MYKVTAYFKDRKITEKFHNLYDAIDFKDTADAHYPTKVTMEKVKDMREFVFNSWNSVMNSEVNPLRHIQDLGTRHLIMQVLAWMWCITFAMMVGSWTVFGISAIAHVFLIGAIVITVATFKVAERNPGFKFRKGYHSHGRGRNYILSYDDDTGLPKKVYLDPKDPGGEHE